MELLALTLIMVVPLTLGFGLWFVINRVRRYRAARYARLAEQLDDGADDQAWHTEARRIASLQPVERERLLQGRLDQARTALKSAWSAHVDAGSPFAAGSAMSMRSKKDAVRKTQVFDQARALLPDAIARASEAIAAVAAVEQARTGGTRLTHVYRELPEPHDTGYALTGVGATRELKGQLDAIYRVLRGLEDVLEPTESRSPASAAFEKRHGLEPVAVRPILESAPPSMPS